MHIIGWHPAVRFSDFAEINHNLSEVLNKADYVSLHMPLNEQTVGIIDKKKLKEFKTGAYLINTGRAQLVVENDIVEALKSGKLSGYATDVWPSDPPPENSPIFDAPNCIFTPHIGASTEENMTRIGHIADSIISDYVQLQSVHH